MFLKRGAGGPKQSKWKADAKKTFRSYFGKRSGGEPLPAGLPDVTQSGVELVTMKNTLLDFVQAGPMDPWASMQKALLDALVLH